MRIPFAAGVLVLLAGCSPPAPVASVHEVMVGTVAPQAQVLWDISNRAIDDDGNGDASKVTADDWIKLALASGKLRQAAMTLASIERPTAVAPGAKIEDEEEEGASTGAQVQGFIDADREGFRAHAAALEAISADFAAASRANDAKLLVDHAGRLDQVCESCHLKFWYPQDAALAPK